VVAEWNRTTADRPCLRLRVVLCWLAPLVALNIQQSGATSTALSLAARVIAGAGGNLGGHAGRVVFLDGGSVIGEAALSLLLKRNTE
jgi:hypothetical protein